MQHWQHLNSPLTLRHLNLKLDNELKVKLFNGYDLEIWRICIWFYVHLISNEELYSNENEYSVKIKPLSGSCHTWDLIYMKVLLRKVIQILVEDSKKKK